MTMNEPGVSDVRIVGVMERFCFTVGYQLIMLSASVSSMKYRCTKTPGRNSDFDS